MNLHPNAIDLRDLDSYSRLAAEAMSRGPKFAEAVRSQHADQVRLNVRLVETISGMVPFYILRDAKDRYILVETFDQKQAIACENLYNRLDDEEYYWLMTHIVTARKVAGKILV